VLAGFVTNEPEQASGVMAGLPRLGSDGDLLAGGPQATELVNGIGSTGNANLRRALFERFCCAGFKFATVIHPAATIASDVVLGEGAQIMAGAVLQAGVVIGANAIVNTGTLLDHDVRIGDHTHIAPGACIAGGVTVGAGVHIGAGATIIQGLQVGDGALVAAGAVVVRDVGVAAMVAGVPARPSAVRSR
jgi:UDP-perosamine 4-acetyltransferase